MHMAKIVEEHGGKIHLDTPVKQVVTSGVCDRRTTRKTETVVADAVIVNADLPMPPRIPCLRAGNTAEVYPHTFGQDEVLCSTFMLYLGLDKRYDDPHHTIYFAGNYHANMRRHHPPQKVDGGLLVLCA